MKIRFGNSLDSAFWVITQLQVGEHDLGRITGQWVTNSDVDH
jgi:hypothetical protein